jgi:hypothetical protein
MLEDVPLLITLWTVFLIVMGITNLEMSDGRLGKNNRSIEMLLTNILMADLLGRWKSGLNEQE